MEKVRENAHRAAVLLGRGRGLCPAVVAHNGAFGASAFWHGE